MTPLRSLCGVLSLVPLGVLACGGTVIRGGNQGDGGKDGTPFMAPDTGIVELDHSTGPEEAGPIPDSGPPDHGVKPIDGGAIPCGSSTCTAGTQECCIEAMTGVESCVASGMCSSGYPVSCSGPASCPTAGDVCCASFGGGGPSVACTSAAGCMGIEVCGGDGDCMGGETCQPSPFPGYKVCRPPDGGGFGFGEGGRHHREGGVTFDAGGPLD